MGQLLVIKQKPIHIGIIMDPQVISMFGLKFSLLVKAIKILLEGKTND